MYARVTTFQSHPDRISEINERLDDIREKISAISGIACAYTCWRDDGNGLATAIYYNEAAAFVARPQVEAIWATLADVLVAPPNVEFYDNVADLRG